jgi:hypothetical protein
MASEVDVWIRRNEPTAEIAQFVRAIDVAASYDSDLVNKSVLDILQNILAAGNEDEIFAAANAGTTSGADFLDIPYRLKSDGIEWKKSAAVFREQGGFPFYALTHVINLQTGEEQIVTCGSFSVVVSYWRMQQIGIFDAYEEAGGIPLILRGKPSGAGTVIIPSKYIMPREAPTVPVQKAATGDATDTEARAD